MSSDWAKAQKTKVEGKELGPPIIDLFETFDLPSTGGPEPYMVYSRTKVSDAGKQEEGKKAWFELMTVIGKQPVGGVSVADGEHVGLGMVGYDSLEVSNLLVEKVLFTVSICRKRRPL